MTHLSLLLPLSLIGSLSLLLEPIRASNPPLPSSAADGETGGFGALWHQWRGPKRDGSVSGSVWPDKLEAESLRERWRTEVGESYSGPVVSERFVFSFESTDGEEIVRAFERSDGTGVWTRSWEASTQVADFASRYGNWVRSTPAWDGESLFVAGMPDIVVCLAGESGAIRWQRDLRADLESDLLAYGLASSPLVAGGAVYIQAAHSLLKLDAATGETLWRVLVESGSENNPCSSPVLAEIGGIEQVIALTRTSLSGVELEHGELLWQRKLPNPLDTSIVTPVVCGDFVLTSAFAQPLRCVQVNRDEEEPNELDALYAEEVWSSKCQAMMTTPVRVGGYVYLLNSSNRLTCIDLEDGSVAWRSPPAGGDYMSLVANGDRLLGLTNEGVLRLIAANDEEYQLLGEAEVAGDCYAHLAVAGNELYIRDRQELISYSWE